MTSKEKETSATSPAEDQVTKESEIKVRITPGFPGSEEEWPALKELKGEQKEERTKQGITGNEGAPKLSTSGTSYANAAASSLISPRQPLTNAVPKMPRLRTHCLVPLHFEYRKQPRRKRMDRSLQSYRASPQRIRMRDLHAARSKREALARHNSRAMPHKYAMTEAQLFKRLMPMLDYGDWPSFLGPPPSDAPSYYKPPESYPGWSGRAIRVQ